MAQEKTKTVDDEGLGKLISQALKVWDSLGLLPNQRKLYEEGKFYFVKAYSDAGRGNIYIGSRMVYDGKSSALQAILDDITKKGEKSEHFGHIFYPEYEKDEWTAEKNFAFMLGTVAAGREAILTTDSEKYINNDNDRRRMTPKEMAILWANGYTFRKDLDTKQTIITPPAAPRPALLFYDLEKLPARELTDLVEKIIKRAQHINYIEHKKSKGASPSVIAGLERELSRDYDIPLSKIKSGLVVLAKESIVDKPSVSDRQTQLAREMKEVAEQIRDLPDDSLHEKIKASLRVYHEQLGKQLSELSSKAPSPSTPMSSTSSMSILFEGNKEGAKEVLSHHPDPSKSEAPKPEPLSSVGAKVGPPTTTKGAPPSDEEDEKEGKGSHP